jgi:hypothetical protein
MDRRKTVRYRLQLPVIFAWRDRKGTKRKEAGFTRDIGTSGLYVFSSRRPSVGTRLHLDIVLPLARNAPSPIARLRVTASVVRAGDLKEELGFAACGDLGFVSGLSTGKAV